MSHKIRLTELDGLRGWAAMSVVTFHIFWESFGQLFPALRNPLTAGLLNGEFAVSLFFLISGSALSAPFFIGGGRRYIVRAVAKRYIRLTLPIVFFTLIFFVIARTGLVVSHEAAVVLEREDWGGLTSNALPGFKDTVLFMFRDVYQGAQGDRNILPFMWTMPIEIIGSMLLYLILALMNDIPNPNRGFFTLTLMIFLFNPYLAAFFLGALLSRHRLLGQEWVFFKRNDFWLTPVALLIIFLMVSGLMMIHFPTLVSRILNVLVGVTMLYLCMHNSWLKSFFGTNRVSRFLGKISFTIYILHYILLTTLLSGLVVRFQENLTFGVAMAIGSITLAACILLSWLTLPIDRLSHKYSGVFAQWVVGVASAHDGIQR